ncbi:MAG: hypothetical protein GY915_09635 [bacterium]|nr:hypothetical protein [bacterium]
MLKRVHKLLSEGEELGEEESEEERSDFELLEKVHGKARYAEIQKALEDSYVEDPTLEQFTQARHELLSTTSGSSLSPVSQLRIIAVKHKNDLDEGWDNKNYGRLASELNDKVGRGKYPDVRSLNSLRK